MKTFALIIVLNSLDTQLIKMASSHVPVFSLSPEVCTWLIYFGKVEACFEAN
jgi:hypothetical protein